MNPVKLVILWIAALIGTSGTVLLINVIISLLPQPIMFQVLIGIAFIIGSALIVVVVKDRWVD